MKQILLILLFVFSTSVFDLTYATTPPPPPGTPGMGGGHGTGGNNGPTGAPVGGGLEVLMLLGAAYAGNKMYKSKREKERE
ncbi:MAG TPA: hypothetical protein PLJ84_05500 [Bacteroidales bacterium]|nr:hypothetical protein [Bacteroidales bacterium]